MSEKIRLDVLMSNASMVATRSQAESWIKLGRVKVNGKVVTKPGFFADASAKIEMNAPERYVSRAGLKLASVAKELKLDFADKVVLDVGSSTGGFTDYALQHGARKVIAVDVGTEQMHPSLRDDTRVELHEKTDIRDCYLLDGEEGKRAARRSDLLASRRDEKNRQVCLISEAPTIVVMDVSFVSLRQILPHIAEIASPETQIVAMVKPQFEATRQQITSGGIVKNDRIRREILKGFEAWARRYFIVRDKADSEVAGANGNRERFYLLQVMNLS